MAKEYIERAALLHKTRWASSAEEAVMSVRRIPAADVAPVRHGRWICINKRYGAYECSVCHGMDSNCSDYYGIHAVTEQEFCPSCGAKMDEEKV